MCILLNDHAGRRKAQHSSGFFQTLKELDEENHRVWLVEPFLVNIDVQELGEGWVRKKIISSTHLFLLGNRGSRAVSL